ncbi:MAG: ATP-binding cassette domain-containing protein [Nitrospinota bacterium]
MSIEIKNLDYIYRKGTPFEFHALRSISLKINNGEFIGVIGDEGSGKSTLIQHINGLLKPGSGDVIFDGINLNGKGIDLRNIRLKTGFLFQNPEHQLFADTVYDDIAFAARQLGHDEDDIENRVMRVMDAIGLDFVMYKDRSPFGLSSGEQRRVAIAGVIVNNPSILVLDDPIVGLDSFSKEKISTEILRLHRDSKVTIIYATHNIDEIYRWADTIYILKNGRITLSGPPGEILSYRKIHYMNKDELVAI